MSIKPVFTARRQGWNSNNANNILQMLNNRWPQHVSSAVNPRQIYTSGWNLQKSNDANLCRCNHPRIFLQQRTHNKPTTWFNLNETQMLALILFWLQTALMINLRRQQVTRSSSQKPKILIENIETHYNVTQYRSSFTSPWQRCGFWLDDCTAFRSKCELPSNSVSGRAYTDCLLLTTFTL